MSFTGSGYPSGAAAAGSITRAMLASTSAAALLGATGAGPVVDLTPAQVKTMLAIVPGDVTGLAAIASSGSATDLVAGAVPAARMPALTGDVTTTAGAVATTIANGAVTLPKMANLAANSILGNNTGAPATPIALTAAQTKSLLAIASGDVSGLAAVATSGSAADLGAGTLLAARMPALTGDVTTSAGAVATSIAAGVVTYAKIQNISATARLLGRKTAAAGVTEECTLSDVLDFVGSPAQGDILYRGAATWTRLGAGTSGQFLKTLGASANPAWADAITGVTTANGVSASAASGLLTFTLGAITPTSVAATGAIKSSSASAGIGYATGAGGAQSQATSKATGVTLNGACGAITMNAAALAAATIVSFVLTNSANAATDVLVLNHISGGTPGSYTLNARAAAGSATIDVRNNTAGSLSEAIVIQFAVIKGVNA